MRKSIFKSNEFEVFREKDEYQSGRTNYTFIFGDRAFSVIHTKYHQSGTTGVYMTDYTLSLLEEDGLLDLSKKAIAWVEDYISKN